MSMQELKFRRRLAAVAVGVAWSGGLLVGFASHRVWLSVVGGGLYGVAMSCAGRATFYESERDPVSVLGADTPATKEDANE